MIRIKRPEEIPNVLVSKGTAELAAMKQKYDSNRSEYDNGSEDFKIDQNIYGHDTVKEALKKAQHDKCCFCESSFSEVAYGDVEHFRPKKGYQQSYGEELKRPGYYWLAYEWSNLFFCCQICNQRYKRNLFPLENPDQRACNHHDDIQAEQPLFIKPDEEDPEQLIYYDCEIAKPVNGNPRAKATIEQLGLKRKKLTESMRRWLDAMKVSYTSATKHGNLDAKKVIEKAISDSGEYAAMIRDAVDCNFDWSSARRSRRSSPGAPGSTGSTLPAATGE